MPTNDARPTGRTKGRIRSFFACAAMVLLAVARDAAAESTDGPTRSEWLPPADGAPAALVYPPRGDHMPRSVTVMLHGMCGAPENECPYFAGAVTKRSWLICPRATLSCPGGGATWAAAQRSEIVEAAIARVVAAHPGEVDPENGRTVIGFSLGAFVAMDLANRAPQRWAQVILLAGKITPEPRALAGGRARFVLGAGELDLSYAHMTRAVRRLDAAGIDASFLSLGRVGHRFADDMDGWLERAYALIE